MSRHRRSPAWSRWALAAWMILLAGSAIVVVLSGFTTALRNQRPAAALRFLPGDARALARRADETLLIGNANTADFSRAVAYARDALAHDATLPAAWRIIAIQFPDGSPQQIRLLKVAERLSRRDVPTQLALLELQVQRNDIVGALRHYDVILRVSSAYDALLFPVMAGASSEPQVRQVLSRQLLQAPMWRRRFLSYMIGAGVPYDVQADLFAAMAQSGTLPERDIVAMQATNSALGGQYAAARRLYGLIAPADAARPFRDGGFEKDGGVPPFDWQLDTDSGLSVTIVASSEGRRLEIISERGDGARAARQLVSFSPDRRHRLMARFGVIQNEAAGTPYMQMTCAQGGALLAAFNARAGTTRFGGDVDVPSACPIQWLELGLRQNPWGERAAIWIDGITAK